MAGIVRVLLHGGAELLHGRRGLFERTGLLLGARRQVAIAGRDLRRGRGDGVGAAAYPLHDLEQVAVHDAQRVEQLARFIAAVAAEGRCQVAGGHGLRDGQGMAQRMDDAARDQPCRHQRETDGQGAQRQHHGARRQIFCVHLGARFFHAVMLVRDQGFQRRHVAQLVVAHGTEQQLRRLVARIGVEQGQHLVAALVEGGARLRHGRHQCASLLRQHDAFELRQALLRVRARPGDARALLRQLLRLHHQQQVARGARDDVDILDDVVGQHGFRILVIDHVAHAQLQAGQVQHAQRGSRQQQQGQQRKRAAQARADFHICHHYSHPSMWCIIGHRAGLACKADGNGCRLPRMAGRSRRRGQPGCGRGGNKGGTAGSVSYLTSNVALSFEKICLDDKTAIFITLFF
ncbi:hypothetical protein JAB5_54650 [Janthinobacterium sp. HH103]|nr:hypothetical protein JAB5_54650 [Janthinobacterium sp. HH103]